MKVYVLPSGVVISPFGDPVRDAMIGGARLEDIQRKVFGDRGLEYCPVQSLDEVREFPCFLTWDNVYTSRRAFRGFFALTETAAADARLAIPQSLFTSHYAAMQDNHSCVTADGKPAAAYNIWRLTAKPASPDELRNASPVVIQFKEIDYQPPVPPHIMGMEHFAYPVTTSVALHVRHWVHVLWANHMEIHVRLVERITHHKLWTAWKLLTALFRFIWLGMRGLIRGYGLSSSFNKGALKQAAVESFVVVGRNCEIHPGARIEFSIIGDNVKIGPETRVWGSLVGDHAVIEDKVKITHSVIGARCFVSQCSVINSCAGYPEGDMCADGMQYCLTGRRVALTGLMRPIDTRRGGGITVMFEGKPVEVGQPILGSAFGHGCFIGPDVYIMPGREIPNGAQIIKPPETILSKIPPGTDDKTIYVVHNGSLTPFHEYMKLLLPKREPPEGGRNAG
ncbi:MAG: hypothetical protein GMKNLPBB_03391 [Myxococcota bacterium]|nr:hypothetical protein [Myxococcota bacterium]